MKVILWGCLFDEYLKTLKCGESVFKAKIGVGGILCTRLAKSFPEYNRPKLHAPIIFINKGKCSGIWLVFENEREILNFIRKLLEWYKDVKRGKYKELEYKEISDRLMLFEEV